MQIILLEDVRSLGRRGEVVRVKPGYARNYLLPRGIGLEATPGNRAYFEQQRKKIDARHAHERDAAAHVAAELASLRLEIAKRVGETQTLYGSVTASDVAEALAKKGVTVDKRDIDLGGGIKTVGDHTVTLDLHADVTAELTVTVIPEE